MVATAPRPSTLIPTPPAAVRTTPRTRPAAKSRGINEDFHPTLKLPEDFDLSKVDPTLRTDLLARVRQVGEAGGSRSLFEFYTPPPPPPPPQPKILPTPPKPIDLASSKPAEPPKPAGPPPPPPIPLKYYGYEGTPRGGKMRALFIDGDETFVRSQGEMIRNTAIASPASARPPPKWKTRSPRTHKPCASWSGAKIVPVASESMARAISQRRRETQGGFILLVIFFMAAMIAMMLYQQLPRIAFESERDKEQLLIERGQQYMRAIELYAKENNRLPQSIDDLERTNNKRYLRHRYIDPYTGKDEWRLIHATGVGGQLTDSLVQKPADPNAPASASTSNTIRSRDKSK
ncbi:MAG: hypothetical protein WDO18_16325 [Acidobacteriota bacterium]